MTENIQKMAKAAGAGGKVLANYFGKSLKTVNKGAVNNFSTVADVKSEKEIIKALNGDFKKYNILCT